MSLLRTLFCRNLILFEITILEQPTIRTKIKNVGIQTINEINYGISRNIIIHQNIEYEGQISIPHVNDKTYSVILKQYKYPNMTSLINELDRVSYDGVIYEYWNSF
jgi:hypothetical protein